MDERGGRLSILCKPGETCERTVMVSTLPRSLSLCKGLMHRAAGRTACTAHLIAGNEDESILTAMIALCKSSYATPDQKYHSAFFFGQCPMGADNLPSKKSVSMLLNTTSFSLEMFMQIHQLSAHLQTLPPLDSLPFLSVILL